VSQVVLVVVTSLVVVVVVVTSLLVACARSGLGGRIYRSGVFVAEP
jgi:hypothetical protein